MSNERMEELSLETTPFSERAQPTIVQREYGSSEGAAMTRNVVVIGVAFMVHFTAFHGTSNLQSSVNADQALGTTTLAVIYGSLIASNIFLPMTVIRWLGCRNTMAVAFFAYMPFIAAQFYPRFYTLIPAALMVGLGGGPLWCAKCTYLSTMAEARAQVQRKAQAHVQGQGQQVPGQVKHATHQDINTVQFFGLFFIFYQLAQVWGNLISSTVLSFSSSSSSGSGSGSGGEDADADAGNVVVANETLNMVVGELCGSRFCPGVGAELNPNLSPPDPARIRLLTSIFLGCMAVAVMLMLGGVHSLRRYGRDGSTRDSRGADKDSIGGVQLLTATIRQLGRRRQLLLLPITMFIGLEEAFVAVDYTRAFVACGWGVSRIGFAMICFGIANALAAGCAGGLVERIGRLRMVILCATLNATLLMYMYHYEAREGDYWTYCSFAALWGVCDGVWLVVVNAFYGILFPDNLIAAYSNFRLWESTGSVIGYAISAHLCTSLKLLNLLCVLLVGCTGYGFIEYGLWRRRKSEWKSVSVANPS